MLENNHVFSDDSQFTIFNKQEVPYFTPHFNFKHPVQAAGHLVMRCAHPPVQIYIEIVKYKKQGYDTVVFGNVQLIHERE